MQTSYEWFAYSLEASINIKHSSQSENLEKPESCSELGAGFDSSCTAVVWSTLYLASLSFFVKRLLG